jgi:hypothetical protein
VHTYAQNFTENQNSKNESKVHVLRHSCTNCSEISLIFSGKDLPEIKKSLNKGYSKLRKSGKPMTSRHTDPV